MKYLLTQPEDTAYCLECGRVIKYGRADKKFCSCECKNMFHNRYRRARAVVYSRMQAILDRNYSVLGMILLSGRSGAMIDELTEMGFNPGYFTEYRKVGIRREYACFDIMYFMSENKVFKIRRIDLNTNVNGYICEKKGNDEQPSSLVVGGSVWGTDV